MRTRPLLRRQKAVVLLLLGSAACGGGSGPVAPPPPPPPPPPAPPAVIVTVSPPTASIQAGGTQGFTATVTNSSNTGVTWTASSGTIGGAGNTITYTAPGAGGNYTVTAASVADPTKSAGAAIAVASVAVAVAPGTQTVFLGEPVTLAATVTGTAQTGVAWTASCGTITGTGGSVTWTAPNTPGPCTVTATSALDATKAGNATLTVRPVLQVSTFDDSNDGACTWTHCSMREAIVAANAQPSSDTIRVIPAASAVRAGGPALRQANATSTTITLTGALPSISASTHIIGPGPALLTIDANASIANQRRVFQFNGAITGSVTGMTVRGGVSDGGGAILIGTGADISLTDMTITQNETRNGEGGGLLVTSNGIARLVRVDLDNNRTFGTNQPGGGLSVIGGGTLIMTDGRIKDNTVDNGGGGGMRVLNGTLTMSSVTVEGNRTLAGASGGAGLSLEGTTIATISNSLFDNNTAAGGVLTATGGAITMAQAAQLTATDTRFTNNTAQQAGGALYLVGTGSTTLRRVTVSGNTGVSGGGGIFSSAPLLIENSTISGNRATSTSQQTSAGGGMWVSLPGVTTIRNSTISGNTTATRGGGIISQGSTSLVNVTVAGNTAAVSGAGLYGSLLTITLTNSLLSGNLTAGVAQNCFSTNPATITSTGYNLSDDATCTLLTQPTDRNNTPAAIGPLADNGGPTRTHALLLGSAAINGGNAATCPASDQRGFGRLGVCDIGAFEFGGVLAGLRAALRRQP